jgi:hypothetical protein
MMDERTYTVVMEKDIDDIGEALNQTEFELVDYLIYHEFDVEIESVQLQSQNPPVIEYTVSVTEASDSASEWAMTFNELEDDGFGPAKSWQKQ